MGARLCVGSERASLPFLLHSGERGRHAGGILHLVHFINNVKSRPAGPLLAILLSAACSEPAREQPAAANTATGSTSIPAPPAQSVAWLEGDVQSAFARARADGKPVLLYWGAVWCPSCRELKAHVFSRQDFIEKSRLFVPVYLDGDDEGAQQLGDELGVTGYPTLLILRPDRTEITRISGGLDLDRYAEALDLALSDGTPVEQLLAAEGGLSPDECKRLAYYGWNLDEGGMTDPNSIGTALARAARRCPADARIERARLRIMAADAASAAEAESIAAGGAPSAALTEQIRAIYSLIGDATIAVPVADALGNLDADFFAAAKRLDDPEPAAVLRRWIAVMSAAADDRRYSDGDRLAAVNGMIKGVKALHPSGAIEPGTADDARRRIEAALAGKHSGYARDGVVNSALNALHTLGDYQRGREVALAQLKIAQTPYYYMLEMARFEEALGRPDAALDWLQRAYRESKGAATRFQWGVTYVTGLVRLRPQDEPRIRAAALATLDELDGPGRIYRRTRNQLVELEISLREWNRHGAHAATMAVLRERMREICRALPSEEIAARQTCVSFLAAEG